jgi:hypothetical protein
LQEFELDSKLNFHYTSHLKNSRLRIQVGPAMGGVEPVIIGKKSNFTFHAGQRVNGQRTQPAELEHFKEASNAVIEWEVKACG